MHKYLQIQVQHIHPCTHTLMHVHMHTLYILLDNFFSIVDFLQRVANATSLH